MELIFIGDIVGSKAMDSAIQFAKNHESAIGADFKIANAENVSGGFGLTEEHHERLIKGGFDALSGGNHIWDKKEIFHYISRSKIARPYNFPKGTPGKGIQLIEKKGIKLGLVNLLGRVFMNISALECPFRAADRAIEELQSQGADLIIVDMHAEATAEKIALANYLDGRVAAVIGTHTHVQTADERILAKGTAYITDLGACCPVDSALGMSIESVLPKFLTGLPSRMEISSNAPQINGVKISFGKDFKAISIQRIKH